MKTMFKLSRKSFGLKNLKKLALGLLIMSFFSSCANTYESYTIDHETEVRLFRDSTFMLVFIDFRDSIRTHKHKSGAFPGFVGYWEGGIRNNDTLCLVSGYHMRDTFVVQNKRLLDVNKR